jgi:hypothetical protein
MLRPGLVPCHRPRFEPGPENLCDGHGGVCGTISILSLHAKRYAGGPENPATCAWFLAKER